jgi:CheY-like chemotaxis protein
MEKLLNLVLADDDKDDRFFFEKILKELPIQTRLSTVDDGEKLMQYLAENHKKLPDVLFLDLNMPRKNGSECLEQIKADKRLKDLPVIIYSTSLHDDVADLLYEKGAHYYIQKADIIELKKVVHYALRLILEKKFERPGRDKFIINMIAV